MMAPYCQLFYVSDVIKKYVRQFLRDFIMNDEKTDMILIFSEWCKNIVQAAHVHPLNIDFFQYFFSYNLT
jgi:hypothetical protein